MSSRLSKSDLDEVVNCLDDSVRLHVAAALDNQHYSSQRHRHKRELDLNHLADMITSEQTHTAVIETNST